jgi:sulfite exporter TauE/SafE
MKIASYVVAVLGLVAIALGVYWDLVKHDHPARGLVALIAGVVVLIAGVVGAFVLKPKAQAA